jgi:tyrosyl-tRNA synthetase
MISTSESYTNRSIYCGFDPTASSLHLGHLCALNSLAYASSLSLKPIAILGTATALIGDPSGKTESRPLIDKETIANNTLSLSSQIHKVFANLQKKINSPCADLRVIENGTFYTNLDLIKFLREVGYYFPVNPLINRDFVQKRADGVTYTEFSYGLLQAYDFLTLFEKYDCVGQIGGSDQWSNITSGTELIRKKLGKHSFGCTLPLLTTRDGKKFGKTEGNALFLDKAKTKSYDIMILYIPILL